MDNQFHPEQIELLQAVYDMRQRQKEYFSQKTEYRLKLAINSETKADALLDTYIQAGAIKVPVKPRQYNLFS